ncbi:hypothetical protein IAU60_003584 [Kwoniella sp. DSM 27419]
MNANPQAIAQGGNERDDYPANVTHLQQHLANLQVDHPYPFAQESQAYQAHAYNPYSPPPPFPQYPAYAFSPYGEPVWRDSQSGQVSPVPPSPQTFGAWSSPPMSPHISSFPIQHARPGPMEYGRGGYYGSAPPSAWQTPTMPSTFGFYSQYPVTSNQPADWSANQAQHRSGRMSWSGPSSRPVNTVQGHARERKAYHPQAPNGRSDWVIPSNTSHEELWRYFNTTVPSADPEAETEPWRGPSSIFLISRSSCAFVNLSSQADLERAVSFFNGRPLRPWDSRCPRMLCRVRRKDDDLRSGVGAQRGTGMHREWVKEHGKEERKVSNNSASSGANSIPPSPAALEQPPEGEGRRRESVTGALEPKHQSSGSMASTNSSFLLRHFPRRIFILKSMTTRELEESVQTGLWRTQPHNEPILDQAFRTSQDVFLIFGANRSGEFFGYAKMIEPIDKERIKKTPKPAAANEGETRPSYFLSPSLSHMASSSPGELTPHDDANVEHATGERRTDPSDLRNRIADSNSTQSAPEYRARTLDPKALRQSYFPPVPIAASSGGNADHQATLGGSSRPAAQDDQGILRKDTILSPEEKNEREQDEARDDFEAEGSGHTFRIEWIKVAPLLFNRTRSYRNPWNADREVKVSRDGTELMAEWDKLDG